MHKWPELIICLVGLQFLVAIIGGCTGEAPREGNSTPTSETPITGTPNTIAPIVTSVPTTPPASPVAGNVLIVYSRVGGVAGLNDRLTVNSDGRCQLQRKQQKSEFVIQNDEVRRLQDSLEKANFFGLKSEYLPDKVGADRLEYTLSYQIGEKQHTIRTMDGAIPDDLKPVLSSLNQLINTPR